MTTRIVVGAVGIPVLLGSVWLGGWAFTAVVALINIGCLLEFYWMTGRMGARPDKLWGVICGTALVGLAVSKGYPAFSKVCLATVMLAGVIALSLQLRRKHQQASIVFGATATIGGIVYISGAMASLVLLRHLAAGTETLGRWLTIMVFASVWLCDSGAYFTGKFLGRHKLFERVSPKKTWEGAIGGCAAAALGLAGIQQLWMPEVPLVNAVVIGLVAGVLGQLGDLAQSHLKRSAGIKDSSQIIPGHGGLFDRFDSILFVTPVVLMYLWVLE